MPISRASKPPFSLRRAAALLGWLAALASAGPLWAAAAPRAAPAPAARPGSETPLDAGAIVARLAPSGRAGFALIDLQSGAMVEGRDAARPFPPASTAKAVAAARALAALGPEARFVTRLVASAPPREGVLRGDLALAGGGDPELDSDALAEMAAQAAARGLRRVEGAFLADRGALPAGPRIDPEQPEQAAYNPAYSGLSLNFNRVLFSWGAEGSAGGLRLEARALRASPAVTGIVIDAAPDPSAPLFQREDGRGDAPERELWQVNAEALRPAEGRRWLPVRHPELYAAEALRALAGEAGVSLPAPRLGAAPSPGTELARRESRPLRQILRAMLRHSTNLTAELVGLAADAAEGRAGARAEAADPLAAAGARSSAWAARLAGAAPASIKLRNHSGLSAQSRVTPAAMAAFLRAAARGALGPRARSPELDAEAAEAPAPGPLAALLRPLPLHAAPGEPPVPDDAAAVAKTGTLLYARGLAGYLRAGSGRVYAFAIYSEDLERRARLADLSRADHAARAWMTRAVAFERALLRSWAVRF
ncbi:D-alanyl-D-alanine carboxypeptidase/D-alanyl-D-alanine endopeptidase [Oceanicella actignis]|uniref:D-alanyl-D-alanine carboxypeptidase/D-alanyl-D-alanine endopeptidase n=1 Tax=Oceanicella actignis TaxID=1189325 RepID=UPI0011E84FB9|nr:D-alanyl-D-alanine carboxypeptidase/D-alanyl-D-alanine-endopeptidase [Oceanicella actignis]TYO89490.1 D-alanyl-D-alanine carboxypeptidase/D-alanyl-D-alanine-endopeptidase (penicillin-binding protein 4) [Oceanicella actignis]